MSPQFFEAGHPVRHPPEEKFNASAWDILSAIERGFRAQVDVKGKLAEWFLTFILPSSNTGGRFSESNGEIKTVSPTSSSRFKGAVSSRWSAKTSEADESGDLAGESRS